MKKKIAIIVIIAAVCFAIYSRPVFIIDLYPMLSLDKCVEITGTYKIGTQEEPTSFAFKHGSKSFEKLFAQIYWQNYHRSIRDILPRGTRAHSAEADDVQWNIYFSYEDVELPDGNIGSGDLLHIQNWYGQIDIYFDEEVFSCYVNDEERWLNKILTIIQSD